MPMFNIGAIRVLNRPAVLDVTAAPAVDATVTPTAVAAAAARPVSAVVNSPPAVTLDHRIFGQTRLDETRVLNPVIADRLRLIRVQPVPAARPGCPAGGEHDFAASANYTLVIHRPGAEGQSNWRYCRKCQGLAFGGHAGGVCPKGGTHDFSESGDYVLRHEVAPAGHQTNWRWCDKCDGLVFGGGTGPCPAGGTHNNGSWDYLLAMNQPEAEGQPEWRWCSKCQGLAFAGGTIGATREELGLPVASSDPVVDTAPFEAASGPGRFHLPRYRLARRVVSGSEQYQVRMAADEEGQWTLTVTLDKVRPDSLSVDTEELKHELLLQLVYTVVMSGGGSTTKTLNFTEVGETEDGSQVVGRIRFASPAERDQAFAAITTSGSGCGIIATRSVRVAAPIAGAPGRFRPVTRGLPQTVDPDPLFLNANLHPYIYEGAPTSHSGGVGLVAHQLQHGGHFHTYWKDAVDPARIFYLPDSFRLARRDKPSPFLPLMRVRVVPGATPDSDPMVAFELAATPWIDAERLKAARREFAKALPRQSREPAGGAGGVEGDALADALGIPADDRRAACIRMEPLPVDKASFWLALPGVGGGGLVERPAAQVDVRTAVLVAETLPLIEFQTVYDALVGGAVAIMNGEIRLEFGGGKTERIPFVGRFHTMNGDLFEPTITPDDEPGHFRISLLNAIESPIEVGNVGASLFAFGFELSATETFGDTLPRRLAPGETLRMKVAPVVPLPPLPPGDPKPEPLLDFSAVRALPDNERIWEAILDPNTIAEARRTVRVKLFPGMFDAPAGRPDDKALAIIVQFEAGPTVELTPDRPEAEARISGSATDIVLRRAAVGGYRYKCQIIRRSSRVVDPEWRPDSTDLLIPLLPAG